MRLLMVARRFPPDVRSGSETVFESLWRMAAARHEVRLIAGWVRDRDLIPAEALGVDLRGMRTGMAQVAMWRAAQSEIRRFKPDVVLSNAIEVPASLVPTAVIVHDLNFGRAGRTWGSRVREEFYRWRATRLARLITPSRATKDALLRIGVSSDAVEVVHNGVDLQRFTPHPTNSAVLNLAYPGRILPGKAQHLAIDAVSRLSPAEKSRVKLTIAGSVVDRVYFQQLKVQARQQPVEIHGDVDDLVPFYQRADLVLFPTLLREGFGYTAVEAMACGRPVAWTDQPAIREATGGIGYPVPPDDPKALRDVIRACLADREGFQRAGNEGCEFVSRWYAWDVVWGAYERVLRDMIVK